MKTIYKCDLCGKEFEDWKECFDHETQGHIKPLRIDKASEYNELLGFYYPGKLWVRMDDGAVVIYKFHDVFSVPVQEVSEEKAEEVA